MHHDTIDTATSKRSPFLAAFGAILAAGCIVAWTQSGQVSLLVEALAFAAMAPVWYLLPISFSGPIQEQWKLHRATKLPKWAVVLATVGVACLFLSVGLRWAA
jgi:multisubunit Na+/H+ antiporter MnhG subunit